MPNQTKCPSCHKQRASTIMTDGDLIPAMVAAAVQVTHPEWSPDQPVCEVCVNEGKALYMQEMLEEEMGPLTETESQVISSIRDDTLLSANTDIEFERRLSAGEKWANGFADFVGSWYFSSSILLFIIVWVAVNMGMRPFEPYPIIMLAVLSAVLASIAAVQGPIILMAQRRQRHWDRLRAENDYRINLKAELEIQYLDAKLEHMLKLQKQYLVEHVQAHRPEGEDDD